MTKNVNNHKEEMFRLLDSLVGIGDKEELKEFVEEKYGGYMPTAYYTLDTVDVVIKITRDYDVERIVIKNLLGGLNEKS